MDNETYEPTFKDYASLAVIAGATIFGIYGIGKLGVDCAKEGIRTLKDRKNQKQK